MDINIILLILGLVVTGIVGFIAFLKSKEIKLGGGQESKLVDKANFYLDLLLVSVEEIVQATNQNVVDKLKAKGGGKLTKEEGIQVFNEVKAEVLCQLTEEGKEILGQVVEDIPAFIDILIEAAVKRNK